MVSQPLPLLWYQPSLDEDPLQYPILRYVTALIRLNFLLETFWYNIIEEIPSSPSPPT